MATEVLVRDLLENINLMNRSNLFIKRKNILCYRVQQIRQKLFVHISFPSLYTK